MSEYISKEWLKEHTEFISYTGMWHETETDEFVSRDTIDSAPTIDIPQWIPCSERLPSEKDYICDVVIWCTDKSKVGVGWYYESTKSWATIDDTFPPILGEVIAWMPLPTPWKGAEDGD